MCRQEAAAEAIHFHRDLSMTESEATAAVGLTAADAADKNMKVHRVGLDDASLKRTAERSWNAISKRDKGRTWSQVGERSQALWMENVRNVLHAATEECEA
ncbi:hypothetical protein [Paenarthrobacter nicotinovorans]|uniref:hypothetical protein n=1 Tax=Paenarthrobacter nicotinovorans TaxID=29320 RepID=UPI0024861832|nr:hypothetical protein [Paenarthrobacter nicotinovorans]MDI2019719.1 hypothetical protein [Paenarthrobacter nicotinovorans]